MTHFNDNMVTDATDTDTDGSGGEVSFLLRPITVAQGTSRDAPIWTNKPGDVGAFMNWLAAPDYTRRQKDGAAFLQGALKKGETRRQAKNMDTMECIAFDVESGERPDAIATCAKANGIGVTIYPTFNHDKPETRLKTDAVNRFAKIGNHGEATEEQVLAFLRERKGYLPCIMETAKFVGRDGHEYVVSHAPLPRFRVVAVWRELVKLADLASTLTGVKELWDAVYRLVGAKLGIQHFDESCTDLSRLFYGHRRPKGAKHWSIRVNGAALDFAALRAEADGKNDSSQKAESSKAKGEHAAKQKKSGKAKYVTPDLPKFLARCAKHFNAADFLAAYGDDPNAVNDGVEARCCNEAEHSEEDEPGKRVLWAMNAADAPSGVFVLWCHHTTCQGNLKGGHFLDLLCQAHGLTVDDLLHFVDDEGNASWLDDDSNFSVDEKGKPFPTQHNIKLALKKLDVALRFNEFSGKMVIEWGDAEEQNLQDSHVIDVWLTIDREHRFRPAKEFFFDVVGAIARENSYHPVRDYLVDVQAKWDGVPRVASLLSNYFSAEDTEFNRAAATCWMVAAVRRVREPGCKFDEMIVLESAQGKGKSSTLAVLARDSDWFTDGLSLGDGGKEVIEQTQGKWIVEIPELHGMRKADIDKVKSQLSRQKDEARLAYGRITSSVPRQFVFAGNSNNRKYLKDTTGNRRFWPVATGDIDIEGLKRDVDQLWGEAATLEAAGESIRLNKSLWQTAAKVQAERQEENVFFDVLENYLDDTDGRIRSTCVYELLGIPLERRKLHTEQVNAAMEMLGWKKKDSLRLHSKTANGFEKKSKDGKVRIWQHCGIGVKELES